MIYHEVFHRLTSILSQLFKIYYVNEDQIIGVCSPAPSKASEALSRLANQLPAFFSLISAGKKMMIFHLLAGHSYILLNYKFKVREQKDLCVGAEGSVQSGLVRRSVYKFHPTNMWNAILSLGQSLSPDILVCQSWPLDLTSH